MFLEAGNILYIKDYQFEDGKGKKDKYLIVVSVNQSDVTFIRSLTTSQQKIPDIKVVHGCCNNDIFSYYVFIKSRCICENDFAFPEHTFVYYSNNVLQLSIDDFNAKSYTIELKGKLTKSEYKRFIKCVKGSRHIKRNIKRIVEAINL